jgi:hypothetical protein
MAPRLQFEDGADRMAFYNETLFNCSKIFQYGRIELAHGNINEILRGQFRNVATTKSCITRRTEIPTVLMLAIVIKAAL